MALLALICAALLAPAGPVHAETTADPLAITIDTMTPVTSSGDIHLTGSITNNDDQTWRSISILPCLAKSPTMRTTASSVPT